MINSFFSCCIKICCSKNLFKSSTFAIQKEEEKSNESTTIKKKKIKVQALKLDIFSKHIIEDIISPCEVRLQDFVIEKPLGKGTYGHVFLVKNTQNNNYYAMKILKKELFNTEKKKDKIALEKNIMKYGEHPFVIKLRFSFQTKRKIFLVMDYLESGDLFEQIKNKKRFDENAARYYAAEVLLALEYLHGDLNIVYRDLKPENILLDGEGHIKVSDFGLSKIANNSYSFCGTPQYFAPEIIMNSGHSHPVDIWSFGCFLYESLTGKPPFYHKNMNELFKKILKVTEPLYYEYISKEAQNLIKACLKKNPDSRITLFQIKDHEFFKGVCWEDVFNKTISPPIEISKKEASPSELDGIENDSGRDKDAYKEFDYQKKENIVLSETDDEETL